MKNVLGKNLVKKKAVSTNGRELGEVKDAFFENDGRIESVVIRPDRTSREMEEYINSEGLLMVSFENVQAIGEYVIVNFPPE